MKKYILSVIFALAFSCNGKEKGVVVVPLGQGEEGKARILSYITVEKDICVRSQGSSPEGYVVTSLKNETICLRIIPTPILNGCKCYLTGGMFIDLELLLEEIKALRKIGIKVEDNLRISSNVHLIMPYHKLLDEYMITKGNTRFFSGIVLPGARACAASKRAGVGIRLIDAMGSDFSELLQKAMAYANEEITKLYKGKPLKVADVQKQYLAYVKDLKPFIRHQVEVKLTKYLILGRRVFVEGAHGAFMDITYGSCYPAVSAESTTAAGLCASAGFGPTYIAHTVGVLKPYATHMGETPFPTKINDASLVKHLRQDVQNSANDTVAIGWLDIVQVRQAVLLNGVNSLAISKLDHLTGLKEIRICTHYKLDGEDLDEVPSSMSDFKRVVPQYITLQGWEENIHNCKNLTALPANARQLVKTIERLLHVPITYVSVGPEKHQAFAYITNLLPSPEK